MQGCNSLNLMMRNAAVGRASRTMGQERKGRHTQVGPVLPDLRI